MDKTYKFKKISCDMLCIDDPIWRYIEKAKLDCYDFCEVKGYPDTTVRAVYSDIGFTVLFDTNERGSDILARYHGINEPVCTDSCVEFFFMPCPEKDKRYINFELSAGGGILIQTGTDRYDRVYPEIKLEDFKIQIKTSEYGWTAKIFIPFDFILKNFEELSQQFKGNFQKCGDHTACVHYPVWNKINTKHPDFHQPAFFGNMILE